MSLYWLINVNCVKARHIKSSAAMDDMNKPFVARMKTLLERGVKDGVFRADLDAIQILITVSGLGFHYLNNRHTGAIVYGRDMMSAEALKARAAFNASAILRIVCTPQTLSKLKD